MQRITRFAAIAALAFLASRVSAQSVTYNFEDGTDQGWGSGFGSDADTNFAIVTDPAPGNGSHYMRVPIGSFQAAAADNNPPALLAAANAAAAAPALYEVSYDWYINTSLYAANPGTFLQLGSFLNDGSSWYSQNFPGSAKEVELSGTQLASGQAFSGHVDTLVSVYPPDSAHGGAITSQVPQTFWRLGLIENGTAGTGVAMGLR